MWVIEALNKGYVVNILGEVISPKERVLKTLKSKSGYHRFTFRLNSERVTVSVHRLQAYQKYGDEMFKEGILVRHVNGDSLDNSFKNIKIGTQSDNMMDIPQEIRIQKSSHPVHNHKDIIKDREDGMSYDNIMKKYNISSKGTISYIVNKSLETK